MIVYIWGNLTDDNFTPRLGKDTTGKLGQKPGMSANHRIPPGRRAQGIDTERLKPPLQAIPDDVRLGGTPGHFAITPVADDGDVDLPRLVEWAGVRGLGVRHEFTQCVLDAVVERDVKGKM